MCDLEVDESKLLESFDYWGISLNGPSTIKKGINRELLSFGLKKCKSCGQILSLEKFDKNNQVLDGIRIYCKKCCRIYSREHYRNNSEKILQKCGEYKEKNRETVNQKSRKYNHNHRVEIRQREKKRLKEDINFKFSVNLRGRMAHAVRKGGKNGSAVRDLGCSIEAFRVYLEAHFNPGMTWGNWGKGPGKWHLDHITPLAAFDLTNREQFLTAAHYTNYQPLWSEDNLSKSDNF